MWWKRGKREQSFHSHTSTNNLVLSVSRAQWGPWWECTARNHLDPGGSNPGGHRHTSKQECRMILVCVLPSRVFFSFSALHQFIPKHFLFSHLLLFQALSILKLPSPLVLTQAVSFVFCCFATLTAESVAGKVMLIGDLVTAFIFVWEISINCHLIPGQSQHLYTLIVVESIADLLYPLCQNHGM